MGFSPTSCGSAIIPTKAVVQSKTTKVVSVRNNLSLRHGTVTPSFLGRQLPASNCFACLPREAGEISVCMELVTATKQKLKSKIISFTASLEGSQHFLAFADPLGRFKVSDESFCSQRIFSSVVLHDLSLSDASHYPSLQKLQALPGLFQFSRVVKTP